MLESFDGSPEDNSPHFGSALNESDWRPFFQKINRQVALFRELYSRYAHEPDRLQCVAAHMGWLEDCSGGPGSWEEPDGDIGEMFSFHSSPSYIAACGLADEFSAHLQTHLLPISLRLGATASLPHLFHLAEFNGLLRLYLAECAAAEELAESAQCQFITKRGLALCNDALYSLQQAGAQLRGAEAKAALRWGHAILHDFRSALLLTRTTAQRWAEEDAFSDDEED